MSTVTDTSENPLRFEIREDDLRGPDVVALLQEHLDSVARHSPPESVHALQLEALRAPDVTFWSVWQGSALVGGGALKELDPAHGELKSMRTSSRHLRKGVAAALLEHILSVARQRAYRRLSLETGASEAFAPAHALYARFGFEPCGPFADYADDPHSVFMTREMERSPGPDGARFLVTRSHRSNYPDPIAFSPGDALTLGKRDVRYPGWIWTTVPSGHAGWAPEHFISITSAGTGVARAEYTARELDTTAGEHVTGRHEVNGWLWVENETGQSGWVPRETVAPA